MPIVQYVRFYTWLSKVNAPMEGSMYSNEYFTITQESRLQANGPFAQASTNRNLGDAWQSLYGAGVIFSLSSWLPSTPEIILNFDDFEPIDETAYAMMLVSEPVLAKDWDTPEEDEAWGDLQEAM
jgi:hypothetical protein